MLSSIIKWLKGNNSYEKERKGSWTHEEFNRQENKHRKTCAEVVAEWHSKHAIVAFANEQGLYCFWHEWEDYKRVFGRDVCDHYFVSKNYIKLVINRYKPENFKLYSWRKPWCIADRYGYPRDMW